MKKCGRPCLACPYIKEGKAIKLKNGEWKIMKSLNCESANSVYLLECNKDYCKSKYIGETDRPIRERIYEHIGYARNKIKSKATGHHFNLPGHSIDNMKFTIIEQVKKREANYRKQREKTHINRFNTFNNGMNREL
jgi:hypothetical protein